MHCHNVASNFEKGRGCAASGQVHPQGQSYPPPYQAPQGPYSQQSPYGYPPPNGSAIPGAPGGATPSGSGSSGTPNQMQQQQQLPSQASVSSQQQQSEGEQQRRKRFREFKEERQVCGLYLPAFVPGTSVQHDNFVLWPRQDLLTAFQLLCFWHSVQHGNLVLWPHRNMQKSQDLQWEKIGQKSTALILLRALSDAILADCIMERSKGGQKEERHLKFHGAHTAVVRSADTLWRICPLQRAQEPLQPPPYYAPPPDVQQSAGGAAASAQPPAAARQQQVMGPPPPRQLSASGFTPMGPPPPRAPAGSAGVRGHLDIL